MEGIGAGGCVCVGGRVGGWVGVGGGGGGVGGESHALTRVIATSFNSSPIVHSRLRLSFHGML